MKFRFKAFIIPSVFFVLFFLTLALMLMPAVRAVYSMDKETTLLVIRSDHMDIIEKFNIYLYDYINDYLIVGVSEPELRVLEKYGADYSVADMDVLNNDYYYYIINTEKSRSENNDTIPEHFDVLFQDDSEFLIRALAKHAEELTPYGVRIRRIFFVPKPYRPHVKEIEKKSIVFDPVVNNLINDVTVDNVHYYTGSLSGEWPVIIGGSNYTITSRNSYYTEGIEKATQYAYEFFSNLGLEVEYHYFSGPGSRNVIAIQEGILYPDSYYMICGHIDSMPSGSVSPGADDNASGSVAVMLSAELFADYIFDHSIIYALWTGEEQGLIGSGYYAQHAYNTGMDIQGVINLDMIAWESNGNPVINIHAKQNQIPHTMVLANAMADVIDIYDINLQPLLIANGLTYSDHSSFWNYGYSAILGIEDYYNDFNPYYHTTNDKLIHLNLPYFRDFTRASIATVAHLAGIVSNTSDGMIFMDKEIYSCSSEVQILLIDSDLQGQGFVSVNLSHDSDPAGTDILLFPGDIPSYFQGIAVLGQDYIVNHGQIISVSYFDQDTGDGTSAYKTASAEIDCIGPEISDIAVSAVTGSSATVSFITDKDSVAYISYGLSCSELNSSTDYSANYSLEHSITIAGLERVTTYYYKIYAEDRAGNLSESGCFSFQTSDSIAIGDGDETLDRAPLYTYYHDNRTQIIYKASDMGNEPNILTGLSFYVTSLPGRQLDNWTIRLKHTVKNDYETSAVFENTGWTIVYQNDETITELGEYSFCFETPFEYNGTDNIMLDLSFNNNAWTTQYGRCYWTSTPAKRTIYAYSDSYDGDPLNWSGSSVSYFYTSNHLLNIEFMIQSQGGPGYIELDYFTADGIGSNVDISWQTLSEVNLLGWNVYRLIGKKVNPFISYAPVMLNSSLIPAQGGASQTALYGYDDSVKPGGIYLYILEAVYAGGGTETWRTKLIWH